MYRKMNQKRKIPAKTSKPCYEIGEDGKIKLFPLEMPEELSLSCDSSSKKRTRDVTPTEVKESRPKVRKVDKPVRKELFKVPTNNPTTQKNTNSRKSTRFVNKATVPLRKLDVKIPQAIEDIGSDFIQLSVESPKLKKNTHLSETNHDDFLSLEKLCALDKENGSASPLESIENTALKLSVKNTINKISDILEDDMKQFEVLKNQFEVLGKNLKDYEEKNKKNREMIIEKLNQLKILKENDNNGKTVGRKSLRLVNQQEDSERKSKLIKSPVILKDAKQNNFSNVLQTEPQRLLTPRTEKAKQLFNSMKSQFAGILSTPRVDSSVSSSSLSRTLQSQCRLLQDTPSKPY